MADFVDYYSRRAAEYEEVYAKPERQSDLGRLTDLLLERAANESVLELACGTGYWTERFAPAARAVLATDIGADMLLAARAKSYPAGRVQFVRADAYAPPVAPGHFTSVIAGAWWSHVPRERLPAFLRTLGARVGDGVRVSFFDNRFVAGSNTPVSRRDAAGNSYQRRVLRDGGEFEILKNFPTRTDLLAATEDAGVGASVIELDYYWLLTYRTRAF